MPCLGEWVQLESIINKSDQTEKDKHPIFSYVELLCISCRGGYYLGVRKK